MGKTRDHFSRLLLVSDGRGGVNHYVLERNRYLVGRAPDNDICIPNKTVSSRHLELNWDGAAFVLKDLGSRNGTFVNRRRVTEHRLLHGDKAHLASAELIYIEKETAMIDRDDALSRTSPDELLETLSLSFDPVDSTPPPDKDHRPRQGELGTVPFRSGRYFSANGGWYFCTREGEEIGPFDTLAEAKTGLNAYLRKIGIRVGGFDDLYTI